jgi:hypothetical protein
MLVFGTEWLCSSRVEAVAIAEEIRQVGFVNSEAV